MLKLHHRNIDYVKVVGSRRTEPTHTNWVYGANQTTDYTCGYHAVFNGWASALGLKLNPRFYKTWSRAFLDRAQELFCIAMLGQASSELLHDFLTCIGFVMPDQIIAKARSFSHTFKTDIDEDLDTHLLDSSEIEDAYWNGLSDAEMNENLERMNHTNQVQFTGVSMPHNIDWIQDSWDPRYIKIVAQAADICQPTIDVMEFDNAQLTHALSLYSEKFSHLVPRGKQRHCHENAFIPCNSAKNHRRQPGNGCKGKYSTSARGAR